MGFDKLAAKLDGISVLRRTLEAFLTAKSIDSIVVVCPAERWQLLDGLKFQKIVIRCDGGATRQQSVVAGLSMTHAQFVAVHDGARPLISAAEIDRCVAAAVADNAAALAQRVTETLHRSDADDFTLNSVSRDHLWRMETPQVIASDILMKAYAAVAAQQFTVTDEVSALAAIGVPVRFIESLQPNLKITTPADLRLAAALLSLA
jgi:2-C-methyl-D-erythritol 4-phosphate cytidylyltransferase